MIQSRIPFLPAAAALAVTFAAAAPAHGQISLDDRIASLQEHVKKKNDDQAGVVIEGISQIYESLGEEDRKKAVGAVEKCLTARREDDDDALYQAAVNSFRNFGELGAKTTLKSLKAPSVAKRPAVLATALRSLAHHRDKSHIPTLTDFLVNSSPLVVAGAADGLGNFGDQPEKTRKEIVSELVKGYATFASAASNAAAPNKDKALAKERLAVVEGAFKESLKKLTGEDHPDAPAWQKWYNDNKSKKWGELTAGEGGWPAPGPR